MRRVLFATIGLLGLATSAMAADLPRAMPPARAPVFAPAYSWTGFYLGIQGGGGFGRSDWSAFGTDTDVSGGFVGGTVGYNWQGIGSPWVFGLEGDIAWSGIKGDTTDPVTGLNLETKNTWLGTGRGRLGYAWDRWLTYVTGGVAFGEVKATQAGIGSVSDTNVGWTVGAGIEGAIAGNWTAKLEYLYVDLGDVNCVACVPASNVDFRTHLVRAGLNWRF